MSGGRLGSLVALELRQRIRSVAWYVLLGIFFVLLLGVTLLASAAFGTMSQGAGVYSAIVFFVLLLAVLVSPALSGNAINGDREAATLAPVQVTLATTGEIVLAKLLAAWVTGLAFAVVALPFVAVTAVAGGLPVATAVVSMVVLVIEIGVVAAIGVGLSGLVARPLFSVVGTYLVVFGLVVGTAIAFGLGGLATTSTVTTTSRYVENQTADGDLVCSPWQTSTYEAPRFDRVWWTLTPNPFVILADATPTTFGPGGYPVDLFGSLAFAVRSAQLPPDLEPVYDGCADPAGAEVSPVPLPAEVYDRTVPSWFVGLGSQLVLAGGLLAGAWARTRTPSRRTPPGTRIA